MFQLLFDILTLIWCINLYSVSELGFLIRIQILEFFYYYFWGEGGKAAQNYKIHKEAGYSFM